MAQQSSCLHRLLTLLDTGSSQSTTRFTTAHQIGEIAKSHPQDLPSLLNKVSQYLRSKNWDTRVAAAHAIGAIAENVNSFNVNKVLDFGALLAFGGQMSNGDTCSRRTRTKSILSFWGLLEAKNSGFKPMFMEMEASPMLDETKKHEDTKNGVAD